MGGKALEKTLTRRYQAEEYEVFKTKVINRLREALPNVRIQAVEAYASKSSYGDLDLLIEDVGDDGTRQRMKDIYQDVGITELIRSKPLSDDSNWAPEVEVWSCGGFGGELQVDLIFMPTRYYDMSAKYYAFNDLGNLMGRTAASFGLRFGHRGLTYTLLDPDNTAELVAKFTLTKDHAEAIAFLGYDPVRYSQGFETLNDMLEYVLSTKHLNPEYFRLENRNYASRIRDKKRPNYRALLALMESKGLEDSREYKDRLTYKEEQLKRAEEAFPQFAKQRAQVLADFREKKLVRKAERARVLARFTPAKVSQLTGVSGRNVGTLMSVLNEVAALKGFALNEYVETLEDTELNDWLLSVYQEVFLDSPAIQANKKFCSRVVSYRLGIKGSALYALMANFFAAHDTYKSYYDWVLETPIEDLLAQAASRGLSS